MLHCPQSPHSPFTAETWATGAYNIAEEGIQAGREGRGQPDMGIGNKKRKTKISGPEMEDLRGRKKGAGEIE